MEKFAAKLDYLLGEPLPSFLMEGASSPALLRLQGVGMHCGLEYTSFPYFACVLPYSRYEHSLGVAMIAYHFSHDEAQALAGLFHDIATPTFAHVIDFLHHDNLAQEATEEKTSEFIAGDPALRALLQKEGLVLPQVEDYHRYPLCDNPSPQLSADRLEYTLGNFLNFSLLSKEEALALYQDLVVGRNEKGEEELCFRREDCAKRFALLALVNSDMYSRDEDRYAMDLLSDTLARYIQKGILTEKDFAGTEEGLIAKILASGDAQDWLTFRGLCAMEEQPHEGLYPCKEKAIPTKKRWIDPYVIGKGRLSTFDAEFAGKAKEFLAKDFSKPLLGYSLSPALRSSKR